MSFKRYLTERIAQQGSQLYNDVLLNIGDLIPEYTEGGILNAPALANQIISVLNLDEALDLQWILNLIGEVADEEGVVVEGLFGGGKSEFALAVKGIEDAIKKTAKRIGINPKELLAQVRV